MAGPTGPPAGLGNRPTPVKRCPQRSVLRTTRLGSNASGHRSAVRAEDCGRSTKTRPLANVGPGVRLRPATGKSIVHRPGTRSRAGVHPGHLAILAEAHISRGRPTDPHGAPSGGSGQRRCSSRVMGRARSASPCWCRTVHFGPGKVGHSGLSTSEPRTLGSPSSMISAGDQRRGGRTPHLGWLLPGTARGESDIRRVHPGLPETPKGNGGAVPSSPHICVGVPKDAAARFPSSGVCYVAEAFPTLMNGRRNENLNSDGHRADTTQCVIAGGVLLNVQPLNVEFFIPGADLDCITPRPDVDDRPRTSDLFRLTDHQREDRSRDLPDAAPVTHARLGRRNRRKLVRHLLPAESRSKHLLDGRIPRLFITVRQRVSHPASRDTKWHGLQPGATQAGRPRQVRRSHRRRKHPRYWLLNQLEDSRSTGLPTKPDHCDPRAQHHCCV